MSLDFLVEKDLIVEELQRPVVVYCMSFLLIGLLSYGGYIHKGPELLASFLF